MRFSDSRLGDAILIEPDQMDNEGGYFTQTIDRSQLAARGLVGEFAHSSY